LTLRVPPFNVFSRSCPGLDRNGYVTEEMEKTACSKTNGEFMYSII